MRVVRKRGSNSVTFVFTEKTDLNKAKALLNFKGNILKYLRYKYRVKRVHKDGGFSIPPSDVLMQIEHGYSPSTVKKKRDDYYYMPTLTNNSFTFETRKVPTPKAMLILGARIILNFKKDQEEKVENFRNDSKGGSDVQLRDNYNIRSISYRFIYPKAILGPYGFA